MSVPFPPLAAPAAPGTEDWIPAPPAWAASSVVGQISLTLRPPAWQRPVTDEAAAPPLVVVGHDYVGPQPAATGWTAGLSPDDPFARLLAELAQGPSESIWMG